MLDNYLFGLKTRVTSLAAGALLAVTCFAGQVSPFDALDEAPTPAAREALMKKWRAVLPPVSNPVSAEERERLVQRFVLTRNPAIVEVLGSDLVLELARRFRDVARTGGGYQAIRNALTDAVERSDLPEQIKAPGKAALLEGLNSPDQNLRDDTIGHLAWREKEGATDFLLRMIDDPEEHNRELALALLGEFGRPDAAPVIVEKLQQRARGLDQKAIQKDFTFAVGRDAVAQLTARARGLPPPAATEKVQTPGVPPGLVHAASEPPTLPSTYPTASPKPEPTTPQRPNSPTLASPKPTTSPRPKSPDGQVTNSQVEQFTPVWPWVIGFLTLVAAVTFVLKRRR